jgi:hypothetical protein
MKVGQGPNWGCSAEERKPLFNHDFKSRNKSITAAYSIKLSNRNFPRREEYVCSSAQENVKSYQNEVISINVGYNGTIIILVSRF